ncbi:MAG TPA: putative baseplate assembly protein [Terriglobia bacterium]|nr:putative baseplate assembly protein [Terriglobia bacterium]
MPLQAPNLDDRQFADLVQEAKTLIPRYAPEWTNFNESDPGITLVELFAWMTDILLYRLNQVPELNYIKFLQLLGIELNPAVPARADLTFTLSLPNLDSVIIPSEAQVSAAGGASGQPIVFETDQALVALGAKLSAVQRFDGFTYSVETTKNSTPGQQFYPFGPRAGTGSALLLGFDSPIGFTTQQVNLAVYIPPQLAMRTGVQCGPLAQLPLPATIAWEYWDSHQWQAISLDKEETRAFTRSGHIYFPGPGASIKKDQIGNVSDSLYWIRARLVQSSYEMAPAIDTILTNTVSATQAVTIRDEVLGGSDGRPNQSFTLANTPVVVLSAPFKVTGAGGLPMTLTSLRLEVDEGQGFEVWQQVDDFYASGPDDPHYTLDRTTGVVSFGNGEHGRIPVANAANPNANVVARQYRFGGGAAGNVGAGTISQIETYVPSVDTVTNLRPSSGGTDEEKLDDAKLRAPLELKSKFRAVTAEDFEFLAEQAPGARVRRAKALPLTHPKFPGAEIPGVVTVIVVPDTDAPNPLPNETTLTAVCAYLDQRRLLTSEVYVVPPTYRKIKIEVYLIAAQNADLAEVKNAVQAALTQFFHPLTGGDNGTGWEFGGEIFFSEVCRLVLQVPGVSRIQNNQLVIWLDDQRQTFCRDAALNPGELLYTDPNGHSVNVSYS